RLLNVGSDVAAAHVHVDDAVQQRVLALDHRRAFGEAYVGELSERHLRTRGRGHQDSRDVLRIVPEPARVADVYGVALPPFYGSGHVHPADRSHDRVLDVRHGEPVARGLLTVHVDLQIPAADSALG